MKNYKVIVLIDAKEDLKRYVAYLKNVKKNNQAAKAVMADFRETRIRLSTVAGSLREPDSEVLKCRGLKRMNFLRHDYFLLYKIDGDKVFVTNIFHSLQDYENKLR